MSSVAAPAVGGTGADNTSGQGRLADVPAEVKGWNWGAFLLGWLWGIKNRTWVALWSFLPIVWLPMMFVLGAKGSEWAWRNRHWESIEQFKRTQRRWGWYGLVLLVLVAAALTASAFVSTSSSPTTSSPRSAVAAQVVSQLRPIALRTGDAFQVAGTRVGCQASRARGAVWLDCTPFTAGNNVISGSFGVSISDEAVILSRIGSNGNGQPLIERSEPSNNLLVGVPIPKRKPQIAAASLGAVLPLGGTSVICDIERTVGVPTLLCGLAKRVTGPNNALNVTYLASSDGITISRKGAALIRWNRDGTYTLIARRKEPAR